MIISCCCDIMVFVRNMIKVCLIRNRRSEAKNIDTPPIQFQKIYQYYIIENKKHGSKNDDGDLHHPINEEKKCRSKGLKKKIAHQKGPIFSVAFVFCNAFFKDNWVVVQLQLYNNSKKWTVVHHNEQLYSWHIAIWNIDSKIESWKQQLEHWKSKV